MAVCSSQEIIRLTHKTDEPVKQGSRILTVIISITLLTFLIWIVPIVKEKFDFIDSAINDYPEIVTSGSTEGLEKIIARSRNGTDELTPELALNSIIELFKGLDEDQMGLSEKPIDLYVVYGTEYWVANKETFEITFAHQLLEDSLLYEYRITLIYKPEYFDGIEGLDLRYSNDNDDLTSFTTEVQQSIGYMKASTLSPYRIEIIKEEI